MNIPTNGAIFYVVPINEHDLILEMTKNEKINKFGHG